MKIMYDLVPLSMKAQFNLINLPNQSIKLSAIFLTKVQIRNLSNYTYNKIVLFRYSINLKNSQITQIFLMKAKKIIYKNGFGIVSLSNSYKILSIRNKY